MFSYTQVISFQLGTGRASSSVLCYWEWKNHSTSGWLTLGNIQEVGGTPKPKCCLGHHFPLHAAELTKAFKGQKHSQAPQSYKNTHNTEKVKSEGGRTQTGHLPTCRRIEAVPAPPAPAPTGGILVVPAAGFSPTPLPFLITSGDQGMCLCGASVVRSF